MTIINKQYFGELVDKLKSDGLVIRHFTLLASKSTLLERLKRRGDDENEWILNRIDKYIKCLNSEFFKEHISTDKRTLEEVAEIIATSCKEKGI